MMLNLSFLSTTGILRIAFGSAKIKKRLEHGNTDTAMKMIGRLQHFLLDRVLDHAGFVPTTRIALTSE
jgi:hypothetical protein